MARDTEQRPRDTAEAEPIEREQKVPRAVAPQFGVAVVPDDQADLGAEAADRRLRRGTSSLKQGSGGECDSGPDCPGVGDLVQGSGKPSPGPGW